MHHPWHHDDPDDIDPALQQAYNRRRQIQRQALPEPKFPSTGTEIISARLAEARAQQAAGPSPKIDLTDGQADPDGPQGPDDQTPPVRHAPWPVGGPFASG